MAFARPFLFVLVFIILAIGLINPVSLTLTIFKNNQKNAKLLNIWICSLIVSLFTEYLICGLFTTENWINPEWHGDNYGTAFAAFIVAFSSSKFWVWCFSSLTPSQIPHSGGSGKQSCSNTSEWHHTSNNSPPSLLIPKLWSPIKCESWLSDFVSQIDRPTFFSLANVSHFRCFLRHLPFNGRKTLQSSWVSFSSCSSLAAVVNTLSPSSYHSIYQT